MAALIPESNCYAKRGAEERDHNSFVFTEEDDSIQAKLRSNPEAVATLSQRGGFQPIMVNTSFSPHPQS
jgi:hypothetical protein